ncbi:unnamed protein product [Ambrosiozyma monospora]|uniref:Unnamed protein product n=1 Tax=Ambrosiozyma monospora TaxID=43982 RepID=A0ACB5SW75_AMBMO|nr:unnamed protein product [Ambrosiozyma monospora]
MVCLKLCDADDGSSVMLLIMVFKISDLFVSVDGDAMLYVLIRLTSQLKYWDSSLGSSFRSVFIDVGSASLHSDLIIDLVNHSSFSGLGKSNVRLWSSNATSICSRNDGRFVLTNDSNEPDSKSIKDFIVVVRRMFRIPSPHFLPVAMTGFKIIELCGVIVKEGDGDVNYDTSFGQITYITIKEQFMDQSKLSSQKQIHSNNNEKQNSSVLNVLNSLSDSQLHQIAEIISSSTSPTFRSSGTFEPQAVSTMITKTPSPQHQQQQIVQQQETPESMKSVSKENKSENKYTIQSTMESLAKLDKLDLLIGSKTLNLDECLSSINGTISHFQDQLEHRLKELDEKFECLLNTNTKIVDYLKVYDSKHDFTVTSKLQNLISLYKQSENPKLSLCCSSPDTMTLLTEELESSTDELRTLLRKHAQELAFKLKGFYKLLDRVDDYKNLPFLSTIPTREEVEQYCKFDIIFDITEFSKTNFSDLTETLICSLDQETEKLESQLKEKFQTLAHMIKDIRDTAAFLEIDLSTFDLKLSFYDANGPVPEDVDLSEKSLASYKNALVHLKKIQCERETKLNSYMDQVQQLWTVLRPNSSEIQEFLKVNRNLRTKSLANFERLLSELQVEKRANLSKFIAGCRERIASYWSTLSYTEEERATFKEFYIRDQEQYDEELLELHNKEVEKLRRDVQDLEPILEQMSVLKDLLDDNEKLVQSSKNSKRLLDKNYLAILKEEERLRNRFNKKFPKVLDELSSSVTKYQLVTDQNQNLLHMADQWPNHQDQIQQSL